MLICDTSGLLAYFDANDPECSRVSEALEADPGPFVVSPYVMAEVDYLLATRRGGRAELTALTELSGGAWELACLELREVRIARDIIDNYQDQAIGLADASLVVLAGRYDTDRILTLDHRHFRVLRTLKGKPFSLRPDESSGHRQLGLA